VRDLNLPIISAQDAVIFEVFVRRRWEAIGAIEGPLERVLHKETGACAGSEKLDIWSCC
jgi:hypothetical protein